MRSAVLFALVALTLPISASAFLDAGLGEPVAFEREPPRATVRPASIALGIPGNGRLRHGVRFPPRGAGFFTWDPVRREVPNRPGRRWGTDRLVRLLLRVIAEYRAVHPEAPRVGIGDLGRRRGGPFGPVHATHQNGLDADVYYPRRDRRERPPTTAAQIDRRLAQDLVDRFVAAEAELVYVGPNTGFTGPPGVVQVLWNHDNHLHVRIRPDSRYRDR
jgi:murein endopeptidase